MLIFHIIKVSISFLLSTANVQCFYTVQKIVTGNVCVHTILYPILTVYSLLLAETNLLGKRKKNSMPKLLLSSILKKHSRIEIMTQNIDSIQNKFFIHLVIEKLIKKK